MMSSSLAHQASDLRSTLFCSDRDRRLLQRAGTAHTALISRTDSPYVARKEFSACCDADPVLRAHIRASRTRDVMSSLPPAPPAPVWSSITISTVLSSQTLSVGGCACFITFFKNSHLDQGPFDRLGPDFHMAVVGRQGRRWQSDLKKM